MSFINLHGPLMNYELEWLHDGNVLCRRDEDDVLMLWVAFPADGRNDMPSFDRIAARELDSAGSIVSGLILDEIGEDGHAVANLLWKISAYLHRRNDGEE